MMGGWGWLAAAIIATAAGQLVFKQASTTRSRRLTVVAVALFCLAPPAAYMALHHLSLATVYVSTAVSQLIVVIVSLTVLHESYSARQWAAFTLILAGVILFNSSLLP
jgi:multidrug transporter EmrE-like cation transporter